MPQPSGRPTLGTPRRRDGPRLALAVTHAQALDISEADLEEAERSTAEALRHVRDADPSEEGGATTEACRPPERIPGSEFVDGGKPGDRRNSWTWKRRKSQSEVAPASLHFRGASPYD